eukprot:CAMPEP_0176393326 /NCGR_PEP_ID=MMETSP0126-20121128/41620_1 /TAXON_ID=141414 ORGANISM="Strombidinopsis acuminatum, Strain SPMC142" /NCGR_SAMPLE_ID=MMETSP0126 /ASSEMBLY_ACC=CAM_ASM_000229 /LENGTH=142 /DNA_ID=CAMNT_0017764739 /DNA_START=1251 /DNA_END=1679 /DNA_ORIENTATION=+
MQDSEYLTQSFYSAFVTYNERWAAYQEYKNKNGGKSPTSSPKNSDKGEGKRDREDMDSEEEEMMMRMGGPRGRREREMMMREFGMDGMRGRHGRSRGPTMPEGIHGKQLPCKLNTLADGKFHEQDHERQSSMIKWDVPYIRK